VQIIYRIVSYRTYLKPFYCTWSKG